MALFPVQRYPNGLLEMLGLKGLSPPRALADEIVGHLDLLQFYGQSQLQNLSASNAALAENGIITVTPQESAWTLLFGVACVIVKTGTMTACEGAWSKGPIASAQWLASTGSLFPFGATETGAVRRGFRFPYPLILPPATPINFVLSILGTDATANCSVQAEFGVFG